MRSPRRAEDVVVGGGVIGTSAAFHLAETGAEVLLLERAGPASGSTSTAAGTSCEKKPARPPGSVRGTGREG